MVIILPAYLTAEKDAAAVCLRSAAALGRMKGTGGDTHFVSFYTLKINKL